MLLFSSTTVNTCWMSIFRSSPNQLMLPLPCSHHKGSSPTLDTAHVRGLIWNRAPWRRGTLRLARRVCRHEACQRAFKETEPPKESRWLQELPPLMDCTCSPLTPLPEVPFNQCPETLQGFEVEECLNAGLVSAAPAHIRQPMIHYTHTNKLEGKIYVVYPFLFISMSDISTSFLDFKLKYLTYYI